MFQISTNVTPTEAITESIVSDKPSLNLLTPGTPAPNFTIQDVDTGEWYSLVDFRGQLVFIDTFATWCGPCKEALPYMVDIFNKYTSDMVQFISIDESASDSLNLVKSFRKSENMDWIVSFNASGTIWDDYQVVGIPTFYGIDENGDIFYVQEGFGVSVYDDWLALFGGLLPDDTAEPVFNTVEFTTGTELSVLEPYIFVDLNITEDRNIKRVKLDISTSDESISEYFDPVKDGIHSIVDTKITFDPKFLYDETNLALVLYASDYWDNENQTSTYNLAVTDHDDTGPPVLGDVSVSYIEINENEFNVTIIAEITEDLLLIQAVAKLMIEDSNVKVEAFVPVNATHMKVETTIQYSKALPEDLVAKIVLEDVAGNLVEETYNVGAVKTSYSFILALFAIILPVVLVRYRKKK